MQPLIMLTNVHKARLLHALLIQEIPQFLSYLNELAGTVINDPNELQSNWTDLIFRTEHWCGIAQEIRTKIANYPNEIYRDSAVFAELLFAGDAAAFSVHALIRYVALGKHDDPHFKSAVELLFF